MRTCDTLKIKQAYTGVYIFENTSPPPGGGNISLCHLGKKYEKMKRKRGENVKEKGRNRKENEKRGSKWVK